MRNHKLHFITILLVLALILNIFSLIPVKAATTALTTLSDTMSRLKISVNSSHIIKFTTPNAIQTAADTITITFPSDFNFTSSVITDVTFTHGATTGAENTETLAATPSATEWGAVFSGTQLRVLTLTAPTDGIGTAAVAANDKIILTYASTHAVNGSTSATGYTLTIAVAGSSTESGQIQVYLVADDQVAVSATVDPTLTFSISDLAIGFGHFVGTAIRWATSDETGSASQPASGNPTTFTAATNGVNGWAITIQDQGNGSSPGLYSSGTSELIPTDASYNVTTGSKKYGAYGKEAASGVTIHENFNGSNPDSPLSRTAQTFATTAAPSGNKTIDLGLMAAVDATTKAGIYADTITVICTGNY